MHYGGREGATRFFFWLRGDWLRRETGQTRHQELMVKMGKTALLRSQWTHASSFFKPYKTAADRRPFRAFLFRGSRARPHFASNVGNAGIT